MTTKDKMNKAVTEITAFAGVFVMSMVLALLMAPDSLEVALVLLLIATASCIVIMIAYNDYLELKDTVLNEQIEANFQAKVKQYHEDCTKQYNDMLMAHEAEEVYISNVIANLEREQEFKHTCGDNTTEAYMY